MKLHDYQEVAADHLRRHHRAALFLEMGLGKTAATLSALTPDHLPALVVAPKRVAENVWPEERALWRPDLTMAVAAGSPAARRDALRSGADVVVIGRDNLADAVHPGVTPPRTFIMDEMSSFKNRASKRWRHAKKISAGAQYVWGLTGTPAPGGYLDLWPQMYLLDHGKRLGRTLTEYRHRYFMPGPRLPNGIVTRWDPFPDTEAKVNRLIEDVCLSMTNDGRIPLPPVTYNRVQVPLPPAVMKDYRTLKEQFVLRMDLLGEAAFSAETAATLTGMMSQLTAGFLYLQEAMLLDDPTVFDRLDGATHLPIHREKVNAVREIVDGTGSPVLVFYRFRAELEMLQKEFGDDAVAIAGPDTLKDWNAGRIRVLLAHPASAGHGLNIQRGGHTIVWTSPPWSLEEWQQGNGRLIRQGQKHPVVVHTLISPKTIDPLIERRLQTKAAVQDALMEYLESPL